MPEGLSTLGLRDASLPIPGSDVREALYLIQGATHDRSILADPSAEDGGIAARQGSVPETRSSLGVPHLLVASRGLGMGRATLLAEISF